jgi:Leucine-rich repeat (LRR) protein
MLTELWLLFNKLTSIPPEIGRLRSLRGLVVSDFFHWRL